MDEPMWTQSPRCAERGRPRALFTAIVNTECWVQLSASLSARLVIPFDPHASTAHVHAHTRPTPHPPPWPTLTHSTGGDNYGVINASGVGFNNYNTLVRSSALDRTVQSVVSFLAGIFPAVEKVSPSEYLPSGQQVCMGMRGGGA